MATDRSINRSFCTARLTTAYAHVGLYDVKTQRPWIARKRWGVNPIKVSHARLLKGGDDAASTAEKDRFVCFWFHPPHTGDGVVQGQPVAWDEAHLLVRIDPLWSYATQKLISATDTRRIERNTDEQFAWGDVLFNAYVRAGLTHPTTLHMVGPRTEDSVFNLRRAEP